MRNDTTGAPAPKAKAPDPCPALPSSLAAEIGAAHSASIYGNPAYGNLARLVGLDGVRYSAVHTTQEVELDEATMRRLVRNELPVPDDMRQRVEARERGRALEAADRISANLQKFCNGQTLPVVREPALRTLAAYASQAAPGERGQESVALETHVDERTVRRRILELKRLKLLEASSHPWPTPLGLAVLAAAAARGVRSVSGMGPTH